ncbi:hypothetical protein HY450_02930 [Candidatus Pacearchaeota archaeon]|nr:hypothetical protein [Candidatus Pacearchaeota archaeon]
MNRRNKFLTAGIIGIGCVYYTAYFLRSLPDKSVQTTLESGLEVRVHRYERENITDVEVKYKEWIMDVNNDWSPDFRRKRSGQFYEIIYDEQLRKGDKGIFEEATEKAGLRK